MWGIPELTAAIKGLTGIAAATIRTIATSADTMALAAVKLVVAVEKNTAASERQTAAIEKLIAAMTPPPSPIGHIRFRLLREENSMLVYEVDLPQLPADDPNAKDVTKGLLRLSFDGTEQPQIETTVGQSVLENVQIPQGVNVTGDFVFVDDAGNLSPHAVEVTPFVASDTIPPPDPVGGLAFRAVSEE